jgi:hypothetical protein
MTGARPGEEAGRPKQPVPNGERRRPRLERPSGNGNPILSETARPSLDQGLYHGVDHGFDPAMLIGLAIAFARQGCISGGPAAAVPAPVLQPLEAAARGGCGASAMVIDWLNRRGGRPHLQEAAPEIRKATPTPGLMAPRKGNRHE